MSKKILVPLDGSEQSEKAFEFVLEEFPDESIVLLHIIDPVAAGYFAYEGNTIFHSGTVERTEEGVANFLENHVEKAEESGVDATSEQITGEPANSIVKYAEENEIDHIVMGSHGRKGASRILLGSVAEKVVRRSPTPVTVVR